MDRPVSSLPVDLPDSPLAARLAAAGDSPLLNRRDTGIAVVTLPEGRPVFARNPARLLRPASTLKILTGAAALARLKPEFVYTTDVYGDRSIDADGTLRGNLYIKGSGAPDLVGESWWRIVRELAGLGLRRVTGSLIADDTFFDAASRPPGWPSDSTDSWYNAPVGALSCNFNVVTVRVDPAAAAGEPPSVRLDPTGSYFRIRNRARTALRRTSLSVDRLFEDGRNILVVNGTIRHGGRPVVRHLAVEDASLYALHTFRDLALAEGILIAGELRRGRAPVTAQLLHRHRSRSLAVLVRDMNKNSNNFMAEALLKTIGATAGGPPGTTDKGIAALHDSLNTLGIDTSQAQIADGSGLSGRNRLTVEILIDTLVWANSDFTIGPELISSLSVGGIDGTLDRRFTANGALRRVRAKTGRLAGVSSLAGYVANHDGRRFAFAILANDTRGPVDAIQQAIDRIVDVVAISTDADLPVDLTASASR